MDQTPAIVEPRSASTIGESLDPLAPLYLLRFDFDDDFLLGKDNAFTAGLSLQVHSPMNDIWSRDFAGWIGRVPGLGDDGEGRRIVRWAVGITQVIVTPKDITDPSPQPDDAPWAGMLGASVSWSAYDNRRLAALQVYAGCLGPCSGAESVQTFTHQDLGLGPTPQGWDNQLVNRALANVNYEYRYKIVPAAAELYFLQDRFSQDLSVGGQAGVGSVDSFLRAQIEYRFGWGLPMGFTPTSDPPGWGIMVDPIYVDPLEPSPSDLRVWHPYFTLMGRLSWITYMAIAEGGETVDGDRQPPLPSYPGRYQILAGLHVVRIPFSFHATYFHDFDQASTGIRGSSDWINLSFEYRF
jgi:hypothetical protein